MDIQKLEHARDILNDFFELKTKIDRLDIILNTDQGDDSKRNIAGFVVSPILYYSIYEQIKSEYMAAFNEMKSQLELQQKKAIEIFNQ